MSLKTVAWIVWPTWMVCMCGVFAGFVFMAAVNDTGWDIWRVVFLGAAYCVGREIRDFLRLPPPWKI